MMSKQRRADLMLLLVTAFWGVSYYFSDICLKTMPPMTLTAFRFVTGFALLFAVFLPRLRRLSRATAKAMPWIDAPSATTSSGWTPLLG